MSNDNNQYVPLDNSNSQTPNILDKLGEPRFNAESAKIAEEAKIGTLDDNTDITDPDYDEAKTQAIEATLQPKITTEIK